MPLRSSHAVFCGLKRVHRLPADEESKIMWIEPHETSFCEKQNTLIRLFNGVKN